MKLKKVNKIFKKAEIEKIKLDIYIYEKPSRSTSNYKLVLDFKSGIFSKSINLPLNRDQAEELIELGFEYDTVKSNS
jgi:hypothetical protein